MGKRIELAGQRFNRWEVLEYDEQATKNSKSRKAYWKCKCDCGTIKSVPGVYLRNGVSKSCGCWNQEMRSKTHMKNLVQQKFGYLTAIKPTDERGCDGSIVWLCKCECGNYTQVTSNNLIFLRTLSCGCFGASYGEKQIIDCLRQNNIVYEKEKTFLDLKYDNGYSPRYDFYLPDYNRLIEFDGIQHYRENGGWNKNLQIQQQRDAVKNNYAKEHSISLVRIPYWERNNITLDLLLGNKYLVNTNN